MIAGKKKRRVAGDPVFSHFNAQHHAKMVDVGTKPVTNRVAIASGRVLMRQETLTLITSGGTAKGDPLAVAQVAGIMAVKKTPDLIPMCHPLLITGVDIQFKGVSPKKHIKASSVAFIEIMATVKSSGPTGVEMEALTAVSVAALTLYDMCKSQDKAIQISHIHLLHKRGGKSGVYTAATRVDDVE